MHSIDTPAGDLRRLQDDWDAAARHHRIRALRDASSDDHWTASMAYGVAAIALAPFAIHLALFALRVLV